MHGADKFQNGPGQFAAESTRDGKEILLKHRLRAKRNHKLSKEKTSAGMKPAVNPRSSVRIGW